MPCSHVLALNFPFRLKKGHSSSAEAVRGYRIRMLIFLIRHPPERWNNLCFKYRSKRCTIVCYLTAKRCLQVTLTDFSQG